MFETNWVFEFFGLLFLSLVIGMAGIIVEPDPTYEKLNVTPVELHHYGEWYVMISKDNIELRTKDKIIWAKFAKFKPCVAHVEGVIIKKVTNETKMEN